MKANYLPDLPFNIFQRRLDSKKKVNMVGQDIVLSDYEVFISKQCYYCAKIEIIVVNSVCWRVLRLRPFSIY